MNQFIQDKTQEISFAVLRVAAYIRRFDLRKKIENLAYHLVENIFYQNFELALATIDTIAGFITLGANVYEIENVNAKILFEQLEILRVAVKRVAGVEPINHFETFFRAKAHTFTVAQKSTPGDLLIKESKKDEIRQSKTKANSEVDINLFPAIPAIRQDQVNAATSDDNALRAIIRQSAIIEKIRQNGNMRLQLRDLADQFPEVSERTLRYDLKKLCDQGRLVRQGNGGPSNFYTVNQV